MIEFLLALLALALGLLIAFLFGLGLGYVAWVLLHGVFGPHLCPCGKRWVWKP